MGSYLKRLEEQLGASGLGWENHFEKISPGITKAYQQGWAVLIIGTSTVAAIGAFYI
jgi:hypothetical protein